VLPSSVTVTQNRDLHRRQHSLPETICRPHWRRVDRSSGVRGCSWLLWPKRLECQVMDAKTVFILGLGMAILLLLGFCATPL
jgi:hypothetical protein